MTSTDVLEKADVRMKKADVRFFRIEKVGAGDVR